MADEPIKHWFANEILPHEAALIRYLGRAWPNRDEISDLCQDIYVKTFEAAQSHRDGRGWPPEHAKSFLFTVARNHMIDRTRRKRIVSIQAVSDPDSLNVLVDELSPERRLNSHQELKQLAEAFGALPERCRDVMWLRKVAELPQSEVAERLGISVRTVEAQVRRGIAHLAKALLEQSDIAGVAGSQSDFEDTHGKP